MIKSLGATKTIREHAEAYPADGPADEKNREDDPPVPADLLRRDGFAGGLE